MENSQDRHEHKKEECVSINIYCDKGKKPHPDKCCDIEFAEVYSSLSQQLSASPGPSLSGQVILLEQTIHSTANIDVSQAAASGRIYVNKAGWYDVVLGACGGLNPVPSPLPVWTVSLFKNGALVPGSTFANIPISPEQKSNESLTDVFVHCNAGDYLEISNTSTATVFLNSPTLGTNATPNSATLKISMLKAD